MRNWAAAPRSFKIRRFLLPPAGDAEQAAICNPVRNPFVTVGPYKRRRGVGVSSPRLRRSHRNRRRTCRPQSPAAGTSGQPVGVSFPGQRLRANASAPAAGPCPRLRIRRRQSSPGDRPERVETFRFRPCSGLSDGRKKDKLKSYCRAGRKPSTPAQYLSL